MSTTNFAVSAGQADRLQADPKYRDQLHQFPASHTRFIVVNHRRPACAIPACARRSG